jgi:predicted dehydrogenase
MKIMIAGLGSIGRRHLRNLVALGERDLLLYRTHKSTLPDDDLSGFPVETDLQAALDQRPDAVIVSNPTALRLGVAIPAAKAGCHLLLEKPVSHSLEGLDELEAALKRGGGRCLVGYQFRFHPGLQRLKSLLEESPESHEGESAIGRPVSARIHWGEYLPAWHPWEDYRSSYSARKDLGGGVVLTLSHVLDTIGWLLGRVVSVWAFTARAEELALDVEDAAEIGLNFASGTLGSVHVDYHQRPPAHWLEIIGTAGTLRWDNSRARVELYRVETGNWEIFDAPPGFERNDLFIAQTRHFLSVLQGESEPVCGLKDGVQALTLALAALESARRGQLVRL